MTDQIPADWIARGAIVGPSLAEQMAGKHIAGPLKAKAANPRGTGKGENKTELRFYNENLKPRLDTGDLIDCWCHEMKYRVARGAWYTPEFVTWGANGIITVIEVKRAWAGARQTLGHWEEASRVRWKVVVERYPEYRFEAWALGEDGWIGPEVRNGGSDANGSD